MRPDKKKIEQVVLNFITKMIVKYLLITTTINSK